MRTVTNFLLTNLAVADLCVAIFCVLPRMSLYLSPQWLFGEVMCKMQYFMEQLSYTTSVGTLTVIALERYCVILHPLRMKRTITKNKLRLAVALIWLCSAAWSVPQLIIFGTLTLSDETGNTTYCLPIMELKFNIKLYVLMTFTFLYVIPLFIMGVLYVRICINLWWNRRKESGEYRMSCGRESVTSGERSVEYTRSSRSLSQKGSLTSEFSSRSLGHRECAEPEYPEENAMMDTDGTLVDSFLRSPGLALTRRESAFRRIQRAFSWERRPRRATAILARRRVIRLLLVVVTCFALCILPYHVRVLWQFWGNAMATENHDLIPLFSQISFILFFLNSGLNPMLYAFLSKNFRKCASDVLFCKL